MKKYFLLVLIFLAIASFSYAASIQQMHQAVIAVKTVACDDSGTSVHFCDGATGTSDCSYTGEAGFGNSWSPTGNTGNFSSFLNTPTLESTIVKKGSVSQLCDAAEGSRTPSTSRTEMWIDFWFYGDTTAGNVKILNDYNGAGSYLIISNGGTIQWYDGANSFDSGVTPADDTWYHVFLHLEVAAGDGSETVQIAINEQDLWDAWDLDNESATVSTTSLGDMVVGTQYQSGSEDIYHDAFRSWYGTDMPCEWQE